MNAKVPSKAARDAAGKIRLALDGFPASRRDREDEEAWALAVARLKAVIEAEGGRVNDTWNGASVRLHGLAASSTMGLRPACQNWIAQVTLKSAAASMAGTLT